MRVYVYMIHDDYYINPPCMRTPTSPAPATCVQSISQTSIKINEVAPSGRSDKAESERERESGEGGRLVEGEEEFRR